MSVGSGINAYRLKAGILAHKSNIAPAIADYKSVCYSLLVSREMVFETTEGQAANRTRQLCGFFAPVFGRGEGGGNVPYLACPRVSTPRPPFTFETVDGGESVSTRSITMENAVAQTFVPTLTVIDGIPTTTSVDIAKHFGKRHVHVIESIRDLLAVLPESAQPNFRFSEYTDTTGRTLPAYRLTRDGFTLLAMGFTGQRALSFKLAYIDAFNRMEAQLHGKTPTLLNRRWLVSYDHTGKEQVTAIPDDAFVMSIPEILKALNDPGVLIETEVLFEFCIKALERLKGRSLGNIKYPEKGGFRSSTEVSK